MKEKLTRSDYSEIHHAPVPPTYTPSLSYSLHLPNNCYQILPGRLFSTRMPRGIVSDRESAAKFAEKVTGFCAPFMMPTLIRSLWC